MEWCWHGNVQYWWNDADRGNFSSGGMVLTWETAVLMEWCWQGKLQQATSDLKKLTKCHFVDHKQCRLVWYWTGASDTEITVTCRVQHSVVMKVTWRADEGSLYRRRARVSYLSHRAQECGGFVWTRRVYRIVKTSPGAFRHRVVSCWNTIKTASSSKSKVLSCNEKRHCNPGVRSPRRRQSCEWPRSATTRQLGVPRHSAQRSLSSDLHLCPA